MKTSELSGTLLDLWVAKAEGLRPAIHRRHVNPDAFNDGPMTEHCFVIGWQIAGVQVFSPSTEWNHGGPIIEREGISTVRVVNREPDRMWVAEHPARPGVELDGPTAKIAAMRCYVASRFGEEVAEVEL